MRTGELDCIHGVGHSAGVHGCDGCCHSLVRKAKEEAWYLGATTAVNYALNGSPSLPENPYEEESE